jgi:hypothetical protein
MNDLDAWICDLFRNFFSFPLKYPICAKSLDFLIGRIVKTGEIGDCGVGLWDALGGGDPV